MASLSPPDCWGYEPLFVVESEKACIWESLLWSFHARLATVFLVIILTLNDIIRRFFCEVSLPPRLRLVECLFVVLSTKYMH